MLMPAPCCRYGKVAECSKPQGAALAFVHFADAAAAARARRAVHYKLVRRRRDWQSLGRPPPLVQLPPLRAAAVAAAAPGAAGALAGYAQPAVRCMHGRGNG